MNDIESKRDPEGPDHKPDLHFDSNIEGVVIQACPVVPYAHGTLTELYRPEWHGVFAGDEPIEHLYAVRNGSGMRKEWYFHKHTLDRYMVVLGALDVGLYDGRSESPTYGSFTVVSLKSDIPGLPNAIRIPPGVWHSLRWSSKEGLFVNAKRPGFNRKLVDKFRVPLNELPSAITWNVPHV